MKNVLLIAEKPSLMREIQNVFNRHQNEFNFHIDFLAQAGHLIGLKTPKEINQELYGKWSLNMLPTTYPYEYRINDGKTELVNNIKKAIHSGNYDFIIHAGDPDGEGELLISETLEYLGNTLPVRRFWSNDLTEGAIINALKNLKDDFEYKPIYDAALTRQHADYQFGMNITAAASLKMGDLCKLGRVKAPIIAIIVKRELEIENYVEKKTYKPAFTYKGCEFVFDKAYDTKELAFQNLPHRAIATVSNVTVKEKKTKAPKLYKLSTLQTDAHKAYKWSGATTLSVLQGLYEKKIVTYPRTDCEYLSSAVDIGSILNTIVNSHVVMINPNLITKSASDIQKDKTYCNDKAISTEGHTAIIPTGILSNNLSNEERQLYELICRRFIAIFTNEKHTKTTKVQAIPIDTEDIYEYSETIDIDPGYEYILHDDYKIKQSKGISYQKGMELNPIEPHTKECVTTPPSRYNDGSLIAALDKPEAYEGENGKIKFKIGTPATRSSIIEECQNNGYFTKKGASFYATDKAKAVVKAFETISLFNPQESGKWEEMFDQIRANEVKAEIVEKELLHQMELATNQIKDSNPERLTTSKSNVNTLGTCPKCQKNVLTGKYGPYCSGKCGMTFGKAYGKDLTETQIKNLLAGKKVLVKGFVSKKTGNPYNAYLTIKGVQSYTYNGKTGYGLEYDMEFAK